MPDAFTVRRVTPADVSTIARHRAEIFTDMGELPAHLYEDLVTSSTRHLEAAIPLEEYVGWLAAPQGAPQQIVAGAGVQRHRVLPRPLHSPGAVLVAPGELLSLLNSS